jgi:DnaJ-class molecular chaperone
MENIDWSKVTEEECESWISTCPDCKGDGWIIRYIDGKGIETFTCGKCKGTGSLSF